MTTCREYLGLSRGWCQKEAVVWIDNTGFCGRHGVERSTWYDRCKRGA